MAYNYEYPYTDPNRFNVDWLLNEMKRLGSEFVEFVKLNKIKYANPIEWDITHQYEKNTVVIDDLTGDAYLSVNDVPKGVSLNNTDYWTPIFNYSVVLDDFKKEICTDEGTSTTATEPRAIGDLVWLNNNIVRVIAPMIAGDTYVIGSNCVDTTIETELKRAFSIISEYADDIEDLDTRLDTLEPIVSQNTSDIGDLDTRLDTLEPNVSQNTSDIEGLQEAIIHAGTFATPEEYGAIGDGETDDTDAFLKAIASGRPIFLANKYLISERLQPTNFIFGNGKAEVIKSPDTDDRLFYLTNPNVIMSNFTIVGNRNTYSGTFSEYGHGVAIEADNITLDKLTIKDTGGDGVYIGGNTATYWNSPRILNCIIKNSGRNCISVISAQEGIIANCTLSNAIHQAPMCAIDIEPNLATQRVMIKIHDNYMTGCGESGIRVNHSSTIDGSVPFDIQCDNNSIVYCGQAGGPGRSGISYPLHVVERGNGYRTDIAFRNTFIYGESKDNGACLIEYLSDNCPRVYADLHCVRGGSNKTAIYTHCTNHSGGTILQYIDNLKVRVNTDNTYTSSITMRNYQAGQNRTFDVDVDADKPYVVTNDTTNPPRVYFNTSRANPAVNAIINSNGTVGYTSLTGLTCTRTGTGVYELKLPIWHTNWTYAITPLSVGVFASVSAETGSSITVRMYTLLGDPAPSNSAFKIMLRSN